MFFEEIIKEKVTVTDSVSIGIWGFVIRYTKRGGGPQERGLDQIIWFLLFLSVLVC